MCVCVKSLVSFWCTHILKCSRTKTLTDYHWKWGVEGGGSGKWGGGGGVKPDML